MRYKWIPLSGEFVEENNKIIFKGKEKEYKGQAGIQIGAEFGEILFDKNFSGGTITAEIEFVELSNSSTCHVILYYNPDPSNLRIITMGISKAPCMFEYREFNNGKWNILGISGDGRNLKANEKYFMAVNLKGSKVSLSVNGIEVLTGKLPFSIPQSQVGLWCQDYHDIKIHNFEVETVKPKAFIIMQFTSPFNEMYHDVIKGVCDEFNIEAIRADDSYNNGIIISDIVNQINECKLIIADISPQ